MKSKFFFLLFIALVYAFPFRYAVLDPTSSQVINLLSMVITVVGTLVFMLFTMSDGKTEVTESASADQKEANENSMQTYAA